MVQIVGEMESPRGLCYIDRKNPNSKFYNLWGFHAECRDRAYTQTWVLRRTISLSMDKTKAARRKRLDGRLYRREDHEIQKCALVPISAPILITP